MLSFNHGARIFTDFGLYFEFGLLESREFHKGAWVVPLLRVQDSEKVKFPGWDISSLAVKELNFKFAYNQFKNNKVKLHLYNYDTVIKLLLLFKLHIVFYWLEHYLLIQRFFKNFKIRASKDKEEFLLNPFGLLYSEITASSLIKCDLNGNIIDTGSTNLGMIIFLFCTLFSIFYILKSSTLLNINVSQGSMKHLTPMYPSRGSGLKSYWPV